MYGGYLYTGFKAFSVLMHFLLALQLYFVTAETASSFAWLKFGYFLEFYFWVEMFVSAQKLELIPARGVP
jgi:hypothetical protein